jgi:hypothetical protein
MANTHDSRSDCQERLCGSSCSSSRSGSKTCCRGYLGGREVCLACGAGNLFVVTIPECLLTLRSPARLWHIDSSPGISTLVCRSRNRRG